MEPANLTNQARPHASARWGRAWPAWRLAVGSRLGSVRAIEDPVSPPALTAPVAGERFRIGLPETFTRGVDTAVGAYQDDLPWGTA